MRIHRVATAYHSDPLTVATEWSAARLAYAVATLDLADRRRAERIEQTKPMGVVDIGGL